MAGYKRSKGQASAYSHQQGERVGRFTGVFVGYVKDNRDVQTMGRLKVWIPELGGDPHDDNSWTICSYASPFAGATPVKFVEKELEKYNNTQTSYGFWMIPPDVDTQVLITFADGNSTRGFWFACVFDNFMNQMVPGVAASEKAQHYGPDTTTDDCPLPTTEYNKYAKKTRPAVIPDKEQKPIHEYHAAGLRDSGLIYDEVRGTTTASARRESPSKVFGISTPGPLVPVEDGGREDQPYEVSRGQTTTTDPTLPINRKGGHQFVMDDHEDSEHIKLRTRSGAEIILDETNGVVYITNRDGTAWVEMSESGFVDIYAARSLSIRSEMDVNIRADRDINFEAGRNINIKAAQSYQLATKPGDSQVLPDGTGEGGDLNIQTLNNLNATINDNIFLTTEIGNFDINVKGNKRETYGGNYDISAGGNKQETFAGTAGVDASNYDLDASGNVEFVGTIHAAGTISSANDVVSSQESLNALFNHTHLYIPGTEPPIQTGPFGIAGSATSATGPTAETAILSIPIETYEKNNVLLKLKEEGNKEYCRSYETEVVNSISYRFMTHEPCVEHENTGKVEEKDDTFSTNLRYRNLD